MKTTPSPTSLLITATLFVCWFSARLTATDVVCRVELDREVLIADQGQTAVVKVTLDAPEPPATADRPPVNLSIVLDRSGSMSGTKLERAKDAALEALRRLTPRDLYSLVMYDHNVNTLIPSQSARYTEGVERRIRSIQAGGNTALFGGVSQGAAEVRKNLTDDYTHRIILLSDGLANVGPSSPADLERLGAALIKEGISVTTVGVGTDYNEDLMTRLSQRSDGNSYFVENSRDLPRIFATELGDVLSVVARKVTLEIEFKDGASPVRIIGRDGRISGNSVELSLNQLYGGQEKYALVEISIPPHEANAEREIAVARVRYEDALSQEEAGTAARATVRFSHDSSAVVNSANVEVQREVARNEIAIAKDRSIDLMDEGRKKEAVQNLRATQAKVQVTAEKYGVKELQDDLSQLDQEAEELEQKGMDKTRRKSWRTDSFQMRNQQQQ